MSESTDLSVDAIQRRTLRTLFVATSLARAGLAVVFAAAALVVEDILGAETWSGSAIASATVGTALGSYWLSSLMNERGRRVGMIVGFSLAFVGCLLAVVGGELATVVILLPGLTLVGVGLAAASLARYAAADLAEPTAKAKAISSVVFAATAGAVGGPALAGVSGRFGESIGLAPLLGVFVLGAGFFALAGLLTFVFLRPDPLLVAKANQVAEDQTADKSGLVDGLQTILASPGASLAVVGLAISTAVMVMVMAMTPLHMRAHGHGLQDVGWVISVHTAGMFAFSPLAGYLSDKLGGRQSLLLASGLLMGATALTALAGEAPPSLMFSGLFLLGLGWSVGFVAGSSLLVESVADSSRVSVQGVADLLAAFCSGASALSAGFVVSMAGFHILSIVALGIAGVLGFAAIVARGRVIPAYGQS